MELYYPIILFVISSSITPGPNNVMIMSSGVNHGISKSLPHLFGIAVGFTLMVFTVGMGFGLVFSEFPLIHNFIKIIGIIYLLYLAWIIGTTTSTSFENNKAKPFSFFQALLFQWVNPKAWVIITGVVAAFTTLTGDLFSQLIFISFLFFIFGTPCVLCWLFFGAALKNYMSNPQHLRAFNLSMALLLVISIIPAIIEVISNNFIG